MERVLNLDEALAVVVEYAAALAPPDVRLPTPLPEAAGRVLAEAIAAPRDQPPFDRSTRDGFAVRSADLAAARPLQLLGTIRAGSGWTGTPLAEGQALEIMTGAPMPPGADAVLMVEHASVCGNTVTPGRTLRPGDNVVPRAAEARQGDTLLEPGHLLDAAAIALAASCGRASLRTYPPATVAIVATGDELVELTPNAGLCPAPGPDQIFNSNSYSLAALVAAAGGHPDRLPIARDTLPDLRDRLAQAATADLLLLSGGVSMGKFDLVEQALTEAGAEFFFTGARIQPGKPIVFGRVLRTSISKSASQQVGESAWLPFFGLPGNPVSTEVCFHLFVAPLLRALNGLRQPPPRFVEATTTGRFSGKPGLVRFLPARLSSDWRGASVAPVEWQGSGDLAANARANSFCVVEEAGLAAGDRARVLLR